METQEIDIKVQRMHKIAGDGTLRAFVDIAINEAILVKGIRIVDGKNGLFISMPSEKAKDNKWYESVRCLNKEIREQITQEVISSYMAEKIA